MGHCLFLDDIYDKGKYPEPLDPNNSNIIIYPSDSIMYNNSSIGLFDKINIRLVWKFILPLCNNNLSFFTITNNSSQEYYNQVEDYIKSSLEILNDIIVYSPYQFYINISTYYENSSTIGRASSNNNQGTIGLNMFHGNDIIYLNDIQTKKFVIVLIHEIMHVVGAVTVKFRNNYTLIIDNRKCITNHVDNLNILYKSRAIEQYKVILNENNFDTSNIIYVPIEDDFGAGTANAHFEEGIDDTNGYPTEYVYINNVYYPTIKNEIMSGFIDYFNYLSVMTLGLLQDLDLIINYNSQHVVKTGNYITIISNQNQNNNTINNLIDINNLNDYKIVFFCNHNI
jgi:hypothetical protein